MAAIRTTQVAVEVAVIPGSIHMTQVAVETAILTTPKIRVSQIAVEVAVLPPPAATNTGNFFLFFS